MPTKSGEKTGEEETGQEDAERHGPCGHGMIHSRSGCIAAAHRRSRGSHGNAAASFRQYYRMYRVPAGGMMAAPN
ncbi:hypothetical protein [Bradyrhizobium sp.]|uniref:hypothetical protein n=1 Tax=Bradyrhizobium sp. TaxID=376 RepID=UPI003C6F6A27